LRGAGAINRRIARYRSTDYGAAHQFVERRAAFPCWRRGAAIADINARNGSELGVPFCAHISDQHDPFASRVIAATAGEDHVLDGLRTTRPGCRSKSVVRISEPSALAACSTLKP
jgi:hypothetical protein